MPNKRVIFLSGAIGSGKSTLATALANALQGLHVEGDDHQEPSKPWYASSLSTCVGTLNEVRAKLKVRDIVVVSYPLRCLEWIYYRRHLDQCEVSSIFITLAASYDATICPSRGRSFSKWEEDRIRQMLAEGYARRDFSDFIIRTDRAPLAATLKEVLALVT